MSFNAALSGLRAASSDLEVTGHNIANSATTGFKSSRAEFADIYASSFISGGDAVGNGVTLDDVAQQFSQGTIKYTDNALDLAINGNGFFLLKDNGVPAYTRAGLFSIDKEGFVVTNSGAKLQGKLADNEGNIIGESKDLQLQTSDLSPKSTTKVKETFNLDASSEILEVRTSTVNASGAGVGVAQLGTENGYTAGTIEHNGRLYNIPSEDNLPANQIAAELSALGDVTASASSSASLVIGTGYPLNANELLINGQNFVGNDIDELAQAINAASGLTATVNGADIDVATSTGADLIFDVAGAVGSGVQVAVTTPSGTQTLNESIPGQLQATVGGAIEITLGANAKLENAAGTNVFNTLTAVQNAPTNSFDPTNPSSYNSITSFTIYDTEGISHDVVQYFVRVPNRAGEAEGTLWNTILTVDGEHVGGSDPDNPEFATFELKFNADGSYDAAGSEQVIISNWLPRDANGVPTGALGPQNPIELPLEDPATSSNFLIDVATATAYGGSFAVNTLNQNGYAKGSLNGVDVSEKGVVSARYSNGETLALGQLQLVNFANIQGLNPLGGNLWTDTLDSGQPVIGTPGAGQLGSVQAGALEESNVDLTEQLVNLILAQRNFQANAKTIETADAITQTIINMR